MKALLEVNNVTGGYSPSRAVIQNISFDIHAHEIVALIGLNGAGKSTTIKHILGLLQPLEGSIHIAGQTFQSDPDHYRLSYGYIPESPIYYEELTLWEHIELMAMSHGLTKEQLDQRASVLLKEFRMEEMKNRFPQQFSKGMRQKLMIMMALLVQPPLYIVDEPILGLDPLGIRSLLTWLERCKEQGAGILMSTHILATAEKYCDRFILLHKGQIKAQGTLAELRQFTGLTNHSLDDIYLHIVEDEKQ
ncbi:MULTISPECIES: ABC transporter ATP-binding protein [Brevibacillus]|jgi:ABC-2 type transport system ATP-binding protein|uniref:ABC-type transporter ATP-binding protein EcsA n=1 Tax=Brevibacillus parabrevis TaxID=54914 RepID=A0A4Y3PGF2_BREPA|nr:MULTISPECIES: ABC transporter ATP-binding protein [Brevibacillus]KZE44606.1 multidrug ABC transporter ATP-binding protein [Brevibacillus parabrevis]MBU8713809.1 ABC transporter ATP-binding protein [Brevibacillus parabrevis]MDH6350734.1 ABC-2 type transport system ATP-binding protein [Brevibacillus sp. 1238]MDR4998219.1 ABC transporter ATP-binding protein [Brevibacillus parabrevis]MED2255367.1 ABC transporter ATP-binding protein [Brevibacillus parabrevis]